jgi:CRP-like cAMP-binding protein
MPIDVSLLSGLYPLESMRAEHVEALARDAEVKEFVRGDVLFTAGDNDLETLYVIDGEVRCDYPDGRSKTHTGGPSSLQGRYAIGDLQPRRFTGVAQSMSVRTVSMDRRFLEKVLAWDQVVRSGTLVNFDPRPDGNRWVFRLLQSKALRKLPVANLERLFKRFEEMEVLEGQSIVREGDDGDYFYVIKDGAAAVSQFEQEGGESIVAYLVRGDSFGEDALLSNSVRNATVRMMKPGRLMRLSKSDFSELLKQPVVEWMSTAQAAVHARHGGGIIDVRTPEEFEERAIKGAINIPLARLREGATELLKQRKYLAYCNNGERSAAAAFVLNKLGFEAAALQGGLVATARQLNQAK